MKNRGFPWKGRRCEYCQKMAVAYPHGHPLCAKHAADPNSLVYVVRLEQVKVKYLRDYGQVQWDAFCERTFQCEGKNYEDFTWKEIVELSEMEYESAGCNCVLPEQSCPACEAKARMVYAENTITEST